MTGKNNPAMKCLIVQPIHPDAIRHLHENNVETCACPCFDMGEVARMIAGFDAVITRDAGLSRQAIEAGDRLKLIAVHGTGYDRVDLEAANERNIYVCNIPGVNARSVCELALGLIIALARRITEADQSVRKTQTGFRDRGSFFELAGKTALIIGWGAIGRELGLLLRRAFDMRILVYSPRIKMLEGDFEQVGSLSDGLRRADIISLHTPLRPESRNMLNKETLAHVKPGALLVNTARAGLIDEEALAIAIDEGRVRAAALDVYSPHAPFGKLGECERVIFTPHLGGTTNEALQRSGMAVARLVLQLANGEMPDNIVNKPVSSGLQTA